ncbi:MAG: hypothetical protein CL607_15125 [Anaerolineaceae bacterium]|nr:hypothetical protein [Anaerolineaceae bacterium]
MSEQDDMKVVAEVMQDEDPIEVIISTQSAWLLVSGLQLVTRHPGISSHMKRAMEDIGRQFQDRLVESHPESAEIIEKGWHWEFDVDSNGRPFDQ